MKTKLSSLIQYQPIARGRLGSGFTLVELLIVIVIIAILAAITIVAYNGIQQRANNTTTIQGTEAYIKAYALYATDNGNYPNATGCLGTGYPSNRCLSQSGTAACFSTGGATSTAVNTALSPYLGANLPTVSMQQIPCGGTTYIGSYAAYNSSTGGVTVIMMLSGNQDCPSFSPNVGSSSKAYASDATRCTYILATPS